MAPCTLDVLGQLDNMLVNAESNAFYRKNLAAGQKGLSVLIWQPIAVTIPITQEY